MSKFNFLPMWYFDKLKSARKRLVTAIICVLFLLNGYLIFLIYDASKEYKNITGYEDEVKSEINKLDDSKYDVKLLSKETEDAVKSYDELKTLVCNGKIVNVEITSNEIKLSTEHASLESYLEFIKGLEKSKAFKIIDIQPPLNRGEYINNYITVKIVE